MTNLEQLANKRDQALRAYKAVAATNKRTGEFNLAGLIQASNASTNAHMAWSTAYDNTRRTKA